MPLCFLTEFWMRSSESWIWRLCVESFWWSNLRCLCARVKGLGSWELKSEGRGLSGVCACTLERPCWDTSLALAVGLGVPVFVFLPAGVVPPSSWGAWSLVESGSLGGSWSLAPAGPPQLALF